MDQTVYTNVKRFIDENREAILCDLKELCTYPSVSQNGADGFAFGKDVNDALLCVKAIAEKQGVPAAVRKNGYALTDFVSSPGADGDKTIGLFSHCDVVPVKEDEWLKTRPFEPKVIGDFLYCRGAEDNKSAAVAGVYLCRMVREGILPLKNKLMCYFGGSEETGMDDLPAFIRDENVPDLCLVPDTAYPVCAGEKGILRILVKAPPFDSILSFEGGIAVNAVIGTHTATLRGDADTLGKLRRAAVTADNGGCENAWELSENDGIITVVSHGKSSHAAMPQGSVNAALLTSRLLLEADAVSENDAATLRTLLELALDYNGSEVGIKGTDDRFGDNSFVLGITRNEETPVFRFDIRYGLSLDGKVIETALLSAFRSRGMTAEVTENKACFLSGTDKSVTDAVLNAYREVTGDDNADAFYSAGGTYARFLSNAIGIGTQDFHRISFTDEKLPAGHGEAHQPDERLCLPAFFNSIATTAMMLYAADRKL